MERTGPSRPASMNYPGRLSQAGDMESVQRAGHYRNLKVNHSWFEHQRNRTAPPERHQLAPEKPAPEKQRETRRDDLHPAPAARTPKRTPAQTPERQQVRLELHHGFNAGVPVSEPRHQVRHSYEQQPQRENPMRQQMREAARETLRPSVAPERPEAHEFNRPAPQRPRGLER